MPQVAFTTLGCKVNQFETEVMEGLFKARGYELVKYSERADVYIINTCSVTNLGEKKSRQVIRRAIRQNPDAIIAVTGCYSQIAPEEVAKISGVDVIVGTQDRARIVDLVEQAAKENRTAQYNAVTDIMHAREFEDIPLFSMPGRTRAFLKVQEGCTNFCTYCIIPYARGPLRSRRLDSIAAETKKLVEAGFSEIVLTGIHLGAYGRDLSVGGVEVTLTDAVRAVLENGGTKLVRLRLGSLESIEVSDELLGLMSADKRLCPHLHLPLQSGDDHILLAMNRHYTTQEYRELITGIKRRVPGIAITTDIIVGFPGETEEMFKNTVKFAEKLGFAKIHVFPYSRRTGTPAAEYAEQVPEAVKKQRVEVLQQVSERQAAEFYSTLLGQEFEVLFEAAQSDGILTGLSSNYTRVYVKASMDIVGRLRNVKLSRLFLDGVWGDLLE